MAENDAQRRALVDVSETLIQHYSDRDDLYVSADILVYYNKMNSRGHSVARMSWYPSALKTASAGFTSCGGRANRPILCLKSLLPKPGAGTPLKSGTSTPAWA